MSANSVSVKSHLVGSLSKLIDSDTADIDKVLYMVGQGPIILSAPQDPSQLWFDFMAGAIFYVDKKTSKKEKSPSAIKQRKFVEIDDKYRSIYPKDADPNQYGLPFIEAKRLSNRQFNLERNKKFVGWDMDGEEIYCLIITALASREEIEDWCANNCKGRFHVNSNKSIRFQYEKDYMFSKLRFSA